MDTNEKRSKLYSYFYGKNTLLQQVIIFAAIFLFLMSTVANTAADAKASKLREDLREAQDIYSEEYNDYISLYYQYGYTFGVDRYESVEVDKKSSYYEEMKEYNEALKEYQKAEKKCDSIEEKINKLGDPFMAKFFTFFAWVFLVVGVLWFIYKKLFNRLPAYEAVYDEELKAKIEDAKKKGLEKLNILHEQVNTVEPVVLQGVASADGGSTVIPKNLGARILSKILPLLKFLLGAIVAVLLTGVLNFLAGKGFPIFLLTIVAFGIIGVVGYFAYVKFEAAAYVNPKTIARLDKFPPQLISRIGTDDAVRVTLPAITVYMFGEEQLYIYYQYFNIITGKIFCEGVHEYFYEDIVGITSAQETKIMYKRHGFMNLFLKSMDYLKESISVVTRGGCTHRETYFVDMGDSLLDTQFTGMRNLIRQKKEEK